MALKGNLRDFSTTQLLNLVNLARKTGKLAIDGQAQNAILYFREGRLVHASTNAQEGHLAAMLLKTGKLTREQAEAINNQASSSSDKVMGKYLMDSRLVSRDDIVQGVKDYMLEIGTIWLPGRMGIFLNRNTLPQDELQSLNLDNVILEAAANSRI